MAITRTPMNFYSGVPLDRADRRRGNPDWLAACFCHPRSRFLPLWRSKHLFAEAADEDAHGAADRGMAAPGPVWLDRSAAEPLLARAADWVFLGLRDEVAHIAIDLSDLDDPAELPELGRLGCFRDLREVGALLERGEGATLAYARGLLHWHRRHRFCGACGHPTEAANGGHLRRCTAEACGLSHFPRVDPAVIMLVHDGGDRCVLGRQKVWPPGMHSTLAGFVEPGESLEEAVAREVAEEVGLAVRDVVYHSSQPWPFPSSLMLGFHAIADHVPLDVDPEELESAAWFSREALRASPENERLKLPRADSIARRLIEDWLREG